MWAAAEGSRLVEAILLLSVATGRVVRAGIRIAAETDTATSTGALQEALRSECVTLS